jgi:hypothetical protein
VDIAGVWVSWSDNCTGGNREPKNQDSLTRSSAAPAAARLALDVLAFGNALATTVHARLLLERATAGAARTCLQEKAMLLSQLWLLCEWVQVMLLQALASGQR